MLRQDTPIVPAAMVCWRGGGGAPRSSDTPRPDLPQPNRLGPLQAATGGMPLMAQSWVMALQGVLLAGSCARNYGTTLTLGVRHARGRPHTAGAATLSSRQPEFEAARSCIAHL